MATGASGVSQPIEPDSIVAVTADAYGLSPMSSELLPVIGGTFWIAETDGAILPFPGLPPQYWSYQAWKITEDIYLVDATGGQLTASPSLTTRRATTANSVIGTQAAVDAQGNAIADLIEQVQKGQMTPLALRMSRMDAPMPGDGNGGDYISDYSGDFGGYSFDTNQLWLEITNATSVLSYYNLHNATNQVYAIMATPSLGQPFAVESEVFPANTNCQPFNLENNIRSILFVRAMDWTGIDSDGDGVPDWWAWEYWGTTNLMDTNLDYSASGNTFSQDYSNNIAPIVFTFTGIAVTNNYANVSQPVVHLNVVGNPYYCAVSVDDTNFEADAFWQPYSSSNVVVNLGMDEGWHTVCIGLRGHGDDPVSTIWQRKRMKLDFTPPVLFVTNPTNAMVNIPMIQLQGFCAEALNSISYDLTNAAGLLNNQQILVLNQYYDTNTFEFTTNSFQAFDVALTNGVNTIIFHATDLAGNITTASYSVTLDYSAKTNPPCIQVAWPQDGTQVSGDAFTVSGQLPDATVIIAATITDNNGNTNRVNGVVERTGKFWAQNIPLNAGTNLVTLTATDVAGNVAITNFNVIKSTLILTINPSGNSLWQPTVSLTGNISETVYAVWVNGIKGHNNGDGTWSANNVPVDTGGTATFTATAYAPNEQQPDGSYGN